MPEIYYLGQVRPMGEATLSAIQGAISASEMALNLKGDGFEF